MRHTIFSQLHAQLQFLDVNLLKRRDRAFKVKFAGEAADDYGVRRWPATRRDGHGRPFTRLRRSIGGSVPTSIWRRSTAF